MDAGLVARVEGIVLPTIGAAVGGRFAHVQAHIAFGRVVQDDTLRTVIKKNADGLVPIHSVVLDVRSSFTFKIDSDIVIPVHGILAHLVVGAIRQQNAAGNDAGEKLRIAVAANVIV